jgi:hypothetical protein
MFASQSMNRIWHGVELMIQGNRRAHTKGTSITRLDFYIQYQESSSQYVHLVVFTISGEVTSLLRRSALLQGKPACSARLDVR